MKRSNVIAQRRALGSLPIPRRGRRLVGVLLAASVLGGACSGADTDNAAGDVTPTAASEPAIVEPAATPQPTATPEPTPTATPEPTGVDDVQAVWEDFIAGAFGADGDQEDLALALANGTQDALDVIAVFQGSLDREVIEHYTKIETTDNGWAINDCFTVTPPFGHPTWLWFSAEVIDTDTGPIIESAKGPNNAVDCVPAELAQGALNGYDAYNEAFFSVFNPPDPHSALIEATMTGPQLPSIQTSIQQAQDEGWVVRGDWDRHPQITRIISADVILVEDCHVPSDDYGAYSVDTGEQLAEIIVPIRAGQEDLSLFEMRREEDTWKVAGVSGSFDTQCEFAPEFLELPKV